MTNSDSTRREQRSERRASEAGVWKGFKKGLMFSAGELSWQQSGREGKSSSRIVKMTEIVFDNVMRTKYWTPSLTYVATHQVHQATKSVDSVISTYELLNDWDSSCCSSDFYALVKSQAKNDRVESQHGYPARHRRVLISSVSGKVRERIRNAQNRNFPTRERSTSSRETAG